MAMINGNNTIFAALNGNQFLIDSALKYAPPIFGYTMTQAIYDISTHDSDKYYAITETTGEPILAVLELTQAQYDAMTEHGARTLYIITDGSTISGAYYGDTELDKLYLGDTELWSATPIPPYWVKRVADYAKQEFSGTPKTTYYVKYDQNYNDTPSNGEIATVYFFDALTNINFTSISTPISARCGSVTVTYNNGNLSWSSKKPYANNRSISPPSYAYNNGQMICTSKFDVKLNGTIISTRCDWS